MRHFPIDTVLDSLDRTYPYHPMGDVTGHDPYKVLICCLLSLRNLDKTTMPACERLFCLAQTPEEMLRLPQEAIMAQIYPVQFYERKARILHEVSRELLERFSGWVPDDVDLLDSLKHVGRKTANLVVSLGFNKPAISVDTHVHRITNRLGYVATRTPDETEQALRRKLPLAYWGIINRILVRHGQEICRPLAPLCDRCPVYDYCHKVGLIPPRSYPLLPVLHA